MRFLVVDDDPTCRELLRVILSPYGDCDLAFDGQEAIDAMRLALDDRHPYDLITLDIMMPRMDGHQALEAIRELEKQHGVYGSDGVKVVMTTALHDSKHCIRSFREGCESYVCKPLRQEDLLLQVRSLLGELGAQPAGRTVRPAPPPVRPDRSPDPPCSRFLIVDDDRVCRELIRAMIAPYGWCAFAYDGQEAIDAVRLALEDDNPYDLITLDIMMPGVNGHDALKAIRKLEADHGIRGCDGTKVIMTTALRDSKHCIQSFREGCECYITKPVGEENLLAKMRELGVLDRVTSGKANA